MAGYSDRAFRMLAREAGCSMVCTEMVHAAGLTRSIELARELLEIAGESPPPAVQIFGADPRQIASAARMAEQAGASVIDLNFACPAPRVVSNGEGGALLRHPTQIARIVEQVRSSVTLPVTIKIRKGWDEDSVNAVEVAQLAASLGVAAVIIHGRTCRQMFSGRADWESIARVKAAVSIPVVGNGDVWSPDDASRLHAISNCDAIMIGRGALGNPQLFRQVRSVLSTGRELPAMSLSERAAIIRRHWQLELEFRDEESAARQLRKHLIWYCKGFPGASRLRTMAATVASASAVESFLTVFAAEIASLAPTAGV